MPVSKEEKKMFDHTKMTKMTNGVEKYSWIFDIYIYIEKVNKPLKYYV